MKRSGILTPEEEKADLLNAMGAVYQKADQVFTGRTDVRVEIVNAGPAAAWSDGVTISLNGEKIDRADLANVARMHGLNLHELLHLLYTPRANSDVGLWVQKHGLFKAWNILEDQRIERMGVGRWLGVGPWLTSIILRWVLVNDDPKAVALTYAWLHGRRYLPKDVRMSARAAFGRQDALPELERIIDAYVRLVYPRDARKGKVLIEDFARLMEMCPDLQDLLNMPEMFGHPGPQTQGAPQEPAEQESAQASAQQQERAEGSGDGGSDDDQNGQEDGKAQGSEQDQQATGADEGGEDGEEEGDTSGGGGSGDSSAAGSPSEPGSDAEGEGSQGPSGMEGRQDTPSDAQKPVDAPQDSGEGGEAAGSGEGSGTPQEAARRALDDLETDETFTNQVKSLQGQVLRAPGQMTLEHAPSDLRRVGQDAISSANRFAAQLNALREEVSPGWDMARNSGRFNAGRFMRTGGDWSVGYDRWSPGRQDDIEITAVILVDVSSSMGHRIDKALQTAWALKRGLDRVDALTTVITFSFSNTSRILYSETEDARPGQYAYYYDAGGTSPHPALTQAARIFSKSERAIRILFTITDGAWDDTAYARTKRGFAVAQDQQNKPDDIVGRLTAAGVYTALCFIGAPAGTKVNAHNHRLAAAVPTVQALGVFGQRVIREILQSRVNV